MAALNWPLADGVTRPDEKILILNMGSGLKYLELPDEINLGNPDLEEWYGTVSATISGREPGGEVEERAVPMLYAVTVPRNAPNPEGGRAFVAFLLSNEGGVSIMKRHHQATAVASPAAGWGRIPKTLKGYAVAGDEPEEFVVR